MAWPAILALSIVFLAPIAGLFSEVSWESLHEVLTSSSFSKALIATAVSGAGSAVLSVGLAIFFARPFALYPWRGKRIQRLMILLPYLVPNFVLATAYVTGWNPATGLLNPLLRFPFGLYGIWGMTFLFGVAHMPVAFLLLEDKIRRIDGSLREAARLSGAGTWRLLWKVELPLLLPTLISAFGLCFALSISAFAIPAWIGAPERAYPLSYKIYQAIQLGGADGLSMAASYSLILFALVIPLLLLGAWAQRGEKKYAIVTGKAARASRETPSPRMFALFQLAFWGCQLLFWIAPLTCLLLSTLVRPGCLQDQGLACFADVSLRSYRYVLFELSETRAAFHGSLVYGSVSAWIIMLISVGTLVAFSRARLRLRLAEWIFSIPVATPGAIIALGLIVTCSGRFGINLYNTPWIVVAAMLLKHLSLAFQPLRTGWMNISPSLSEAARLSGAAPTQVWTRILLPILKPECMGGFFLVLIPILGELTMSIFLASPSFRSIGTVLFDLQDYADQASAAALSILLVALVLLVNELARLLSRGRLGY